LYVRSRSIASRLVAHNDTVARLRDWIRSGTPPDARNVEDEQDLISAAVSQGLAPLLSTTVHRNRDWSDESRARLRSIERSALARTIRQLDTARRFQDFLLARGLRSLPLKGAAIAERFYASPAHRPMADVDLLALDNWAESQLALTDFGLKIAGRGDHDVVFVDPASSETIELHHALSSCPGLYRLDNESWWRLSFTGPDDKAMRVPSAEHALVHLSIHCAFQHGLVLPLGRYLDFSRILESGMLSEERLLARAEEAMAIPALASALEAANVVLDIERCHSLLDRLACHVPSFVKRRLQRPDASALSFISPASPPLASFRLALSQGRRLTLIGSTLVPLEPGERLSLVAAVARGSRRCLGLLRRHVFPFLTRISRQSVL
jgi:hypothetical protein